MYLSLSNYKPNYIATNQERVRMTKSLQLQKSIGVSAYNRPIKIAYLVPCEENERSQWILDAVFYESYTRWGGTNTLFIPTMSSQFDGDGYESWIKSFDPDFIYSYVQLETEFIKKINSISLPILFLYHPTNSSITRWRDLSPNWDHYFKSVKSISTLLSPYSSPQRYNRPPPSAVKTLLTQAIEPFDDRFFPDNFGISHDVSQVTHSIAGLYETLCYCRPNAPGSRVHHGSREVHTITEILSEIASGNVYTFANLARVHTDGLNRVESQSWGHSFFLFVGETCKDRINFWNSRLLVPNWVDTPGSLIVKKEAFDDAAFVTALGAYFNKYNFSRGNNSQPSVEIRSLSESQADLSTIPTKFNLKTWSQVSVPTNFNSVVCPLEREIADDFRFFRRNPTVFRLNEDSNEIQAAPPAHFEYNNGAFSHLNSGDWAIDLEIERHNNLSRFSNVKDNWQLPRMLKVCNAFTNRLSKVSLDHLLTLIPTSQENFFNQHQNRQKSYELRLPTDLEFFRNLVAGVFPKNRNDIRFGLEKTRYVDLTFSDKGQNLRGVISMFDRFEDSYQSLTNKFWRETIRKFGRNDYDDENDSNVAIAAKKKINYENKVFTEDQLFGQISNKHDFLNEYANRIQIRREIANKYLKAAVSDSLESLVERSVLFQIHIHRCKYCGHLNEKTIDDLKKENTCSICRTIYFTQIDFKWKFKLNSFITNSLVARNGLSVLWALGYLHHDFFQGNFYYIPEADLFYEKNDKYEREEVDILCVGGGRFIVGEVKKTATSFLLKDGEVDKFIVKVNALKPDIVLLIFEEFTDVNNNINQVKADLLIAKRKISNETGLSDDRIRIIIASETQSFNEYDLSFGVTGPRLRSIISLE